MPHPWLEDFVDLCHDRLCKLDPRHDAHQLLDRRGVDALNIVDYKVGWCPDPGGVKTCTPEFYDWLKKYGWDCLVFPLTDPLGNTIGIEVRSQKLKSYKDFKAQPSELCPIAFGLHVAGPSMFQTGRVVLTEGIFDYFAVRRYTPAVVSVLTANVGAGLRRLLSRYVTTVVCLFDMDATGRRGAYRLAGLEIPPEYRLPKDLTGKPPWTPPFHVTFPFYSEHDPGALFEAGKREELQRLSHIGTLPTSVAKMGT